LEKYKKTSRKSAQMFRIFDSKDVVNKRDKLTEVKSKIPVGEIKTLALDALHILK
jgi:hypothetical protein